MAGRSQIQMIAKRRDVWATAKLASSFDKVALEYDRSRPHYPSALVEDVIAISRTPPGGRMLEIGAGTGKATSSFADRGFEIMAVEPGKTMLSVARKNLASHPKVRFQCARFEDASVEVASYDLVFAAQSFHWVDPAVRYVKSAESLKTSGWLAVFWHGTRPADSALARRVNTVLQRYLPKYAPEGEKAYERRLLDDLAELEACQRFAEFQLRRYPATESQEADSADRFLASLATWSQIASLSRGRRVRIIADLRNILVGEDLRDLGNREAVLIMAKKRR